MDALMIKIINRHFTCMHMVSQSRRLDINHDQEEDALLLDKDKLHIIFHVDLGYVHG